MAVMISSPRTLTDEQVTAFWRDGYVVIEDATTAEQRTHLTRTLADLIDRPPEKRTGDFVIDRNTTTDLRNINHFTRYWIAGTELIRNPRGLGVVRDLLGDDVRFHHTKIMLKRARGGTINSWHQDLNSYLSEAELRRLYALGPALAARDVPFIAVQHYLDESTEQNGCLSFIPGSHNWGLRDMAGATRDDLVREDFFAGERVMKVPVKAGSAVAFHSLVFHYSGPNNSDAHRRGAIVQYFARPKAFDHSWYDQYPDLPFGERLVGPGG